MIIRVTIILCCLVHLLHGQNQDKILKSQHSYSINELNSGSDTTLSFIMLFDPQGRRLSYTNDPIDSSSMTVYSYHQDTMIEYQMAGLDTLKSKTYLLVENIINRQIESRVYGWKTGDVYVRNSEELVRQQVFDSDGYEVENRYYKERSGNIINTISHTISQTHYDSINQVWVTTSEELQSGRQSKMINQKGYQSLPQYDCDSMCLKRIFIEEENEVGTEHSEAIYIEHGDTISRVFYHTIDLSDNHSVSTHTTIYYNGMNTHKTQIYYREGRRYRKENYSWVDGVWKMNWLYLTDYNDKNNESLETSIQYSKGKPYAEHKTLTIYQYY